jgi:23S rRNA (adenine2503-C2)-methyltransferase
MGCAFCASGIDGLARNLTAGEILSQVLDIQSITGEHVSHVVVMGTGEPFDNYEQVLKFIRLLHAPEGYDMSMRNITVSTCGLVPYISRFARDLPQVNLAISLHAPTNALRSELMPVNRRYGLSLLLPAVRSYAEETGRRVTFEYALIHGVNDTDKVIGQLIQLVKGLLCHVNLIPLNEVNETGFVTAGRTRAREVAVMLESTGIPCTVRRQLGADIDGACGQLRLGVRCNDKEISNRVDK